MTKVSENTIGFNVAYVHKADWKVQKPYYAAGTRATCNDGTYQFVKAGGAVAADAADVAVSASFVATTGGAGTFDNASGVAVSTGDSFWVKIAD